MSSLVRDILASGGPIASALGGDYEPRPEQLQMAAAVSRALEDKSHLLVEAGTGVGKSFAYLAPAIERAVMRKETVVVATNTIALQEQLVQKDLPLLQRALGLPAPPDVGAQAKLGEEATETNAGAFGLLREGVALKPVLVKGRGNYVSIRRLQLASERQDRLFADAAARRSLHVIEDWAQDTLDGTLATLPSLERPGVWDRVQSDSGNCMGRHCPRYRQCFYQNARRTLEGANLLICNHALFFADLALRQKEVGFLPEYQHVILDEAHSVEDVAAEHFGISLSEGRVMHLLTTLYQVRSGKGYLPQLGVLKGDAAEIDRAVRLVLAAENASRAFFDSLVQAYRQGAARGGRVREVGIVQNTLSPAMDQLSLCLKSLREDLKSEPDKYELNSYSMRAAAIALEAKALVDQSAANYAYWIEVGGEDDRRMGPKVTFACSPIEVGPILKDKLFGPSKSVILTSATLADGSLSPSVRARSASDGSPAASASASHDRAFTHIKSRLGCENAAGLILGSPFEYATQMELYIERSMPRPESGRTSRPQPTPRDEYDQRPDDERATASPASSPASRAGTGARLAPQRRGEAVARAYPDVLADRILHHLDATGGGAFVLFTSFATLYQTAERLSRALGQRDMPMLVQGKDGPRSVILQRFKENPRSVLLGAASFWQGVDVRGEGLRNVIITRLPFEPPDRPLTEARLERIQERGGDPFKDDSLPRAVIRFKQGFGRLIRSKTDRGRVVVLDPRILTTGYGKRFLDALPPGVRVVQT